MSRPTALVRWVIVTVGFVYAALLWLSGVELDDWGKRLAAALPAIGVISLAVWDLALWRHPIVDRFTRRPRIDGLWEVELKPSAESIIPTGGNRGPIRAFVVITQSYWSLHVRQLSAESTSVSRAFFWERLGGAEVERLTFLYENDPRREHQPRSLLHLGSCTFDPASRRPKSMRGVYFTDRYTKGDMNLRFVDRSRGYSTFEEALRHCDAMHTDWS